MLSAATRPSGPRRRAGARLGRTRLRRNRGLRTGARVERAPDGVRAPLRAVGRRARGGARRRRAGGRSRASARSISYLAPPGSERDAPVAVGHAGRRGASAAAAAAATTPAWTGTSRPTRSRRGDDRAVRRPRVRIRRRRGRAAPRRDADSRRGRRRRRSTSSRALPAPAEGPIPRRPARRRRRPRDRAPAMAPGHGTAMAGVVLAECPAAHVGLFQIAGVAGAARPYLAPARSRRGRRGRGRGLAGRRRPDRDERRRLGDAALPARRAARGGALRAAAGGARRSSARSAIRRATTPARTTAPRWAPTTSPASPGCTRSRRATASGGWYRVYPGYDCPGRAGQRERPAGATYNRFGPGGGAGGAGRAAALERAHRRRRLQPGLRRWRRPPRRASSTENRDLSAAELRALLALTADVPGRRRRRARARRPARSTRAIASATASRSATAWSTRAAACLAAADPICLALLATRPVPDPAGESRALALAQALAGRGAAVRPRRGDPPRARLPARRRAPQPAVPDVAARAGGAVLARAPRPGAGRSRRRPTSWRGQDHGALVERIRHAIDTAWDALGADDAGTAARLQALDAALADPDAGAAVATVLARALCPDVMAADGGQGRARSIALTGDAVGDRRRRRGPRRADGGGEPERVPFARPDVSRSVHRSPR